MKKNFSLKLTIFLVSLFISLLILILGNKNQYCLSFGFICLGFSIASYVFYNDEKTTKEIALIEQQLEELDEDETIEEEEKDFIEQQLYLRENKLLKNKKKVTIVFYLSAVLLVFLGLMGIF